MAAPPKKALVLVLLLALALVLALRKKPPAGEGPAIPSGSISQVTATQNAHLRQVATVGGRFRMGTHLAPKSPNQELDIGVTWTPSTRNSAGAFIPWNYQLEYIIRTTSGGLVRSGVLATYTGIGQGNPATLQRFIGGVPNLGSYDFSVSLLAMSSNGSGQPVLPYTLLDEMTHPSAFRVA